MQLPKTESQVVTNIDEAHQVTINHDKINTAMRYLRDNIYTDKEMAVIRENITNALDAHKQIGSNASVEVSLMADIFNNYIFKVKDYGPGLSKHDILHIFGGYFQSTKTDSNELTGGFGIGAKASWCISDTFTIISRFGGRKSEYLAYLDGDAAKISTVSDVETNERNGLEINVSISKNPTSFQNKLINFIHDCRSESKVVLHQSSGDPVHPIKEKNYINLSNECGAYASSFYSSFNRIRIGDIIYPAPSKMNMIGGVIFDVPIGKLSISLNREQIDNTESNVTFLNNLAGELREYIENNFINNPEFKLSIDDLSYDHVRLPQKIKLTRLGLLKLNPHNQNSNNNTNHVIIGIPDNKFVSTWINKYSDYVANNRATDTNYYFALYEDHFTFNKLRLVEDSVTVHCIKTMGLGKGERSAGRGTNYIFTRPNGNNNNFRGSISEFISEHPCYVTQESVRDMNCSCIGMKSGNKLINCYYAPKSVYKILVEEHGYLDAHDKDVINKYNELLANETKKKETERVINQIEHKNLMKRPNRLKNARHHLIHKLYDKYTKIKDETTLRGKIFKEVDSAWGVTFSRVEIRKVLNIK